MQDRDAARPLLWNLRRAFPPSGLAWADGGYAGKLVTWSKTAIKLTSGRISLQAGSCPRRETRVTQTACAAIMGGVLSIRMNDDAVRLLGVLDGIADIELPGGLAPGLQERLTAGIVRRAQVLTWATSPGNADGAPSVFPDLTGWECADSSFHLEDEVPVAVTLTEESEPRISGDGQCLLLLHGIVFALGFARLVYALDPPGPVRCIVAANETNATFRFHQIRPGERWNVPDLDQYRLDKVIEIDAEPATSHLTRSPNADSTPPQAT